MPVKTHGNTFGEAADLNDDGYTGHHFAVTLLPSDRILRREEKAVGRDLCCVGHQLVMR